MKMQLGHIVQNLFHAGSLDDVPVSTLQEMAETQPYFSTGHLLLSQKLKRQQSSDFEAQVQRTALYFHDPLWLHWQLNHEKEKALAPEAVLENIAETEVAAAEPEVEPKTGFEPEESVFEEAGQGEAIQVEPGIQPEPGVETLPQEEKVYEYPGDASGEPVEGTGALDEPDSIEPPAQPNPEADPPPSHEEPKPEEEPQPHPEPVNEPSSEPTVDLPGPDTQEQAPITEPFKAEAETQTQVHAEFKQPETTNPKPEPALTFEAYHTIDYFASQGIKVSNEVQPTDRLGKQLKSFTEWLKTMKRLPQTPPEDKPEDTGDHDIRRIAAGSLVEKEVVTETMAEVLVKQDKRSEAIAIYEKLSLLDPSKRTYFAAKIENLKEN